MPLPCDNDPRDPIKEKREWARSAQERLWRGSRQGRPDLIASGLQEGGDPNELEEGDMGISCLHNAARFEDDACLILLLKAGANPQALTPAKESALHMACSDLMGNMAFLGLDDVPILHPERLPLHALLGLGLDIEARSRLGHTPLHCAAMSGFMEATQALIAAGASLAAVDGEGLDALAIAKKAGSFRVAEALQSAMDKKDLERDVASAPSRLASPRM